MKTVLITGSNGLLGQKLINKLSKRNACRAIASGIGPNRNPERNTCEYQNVDITNFDSLKNFFHRFNPTEVINTAAMTNVDACELNPEKSYELNVKSVRWLCGLCKEYGARLLHLSTDFIFDGLDGPYKEDDIPGPLSVYGAHKLEAEGIIRDSQISAAILRTILLYGWVPNMSRSNIVLWVRDSLRQGKEINVVTDQFRTPTLAEDLADGVVATLFLDKTGIFHLSGEEMMSIYELGCRVADYYGLDKRLINPIESNTLNQPAKRPPKTGFIILKAKTDLNFKPMNLEKGLEFMENLIIQSGKEELSTK